MPSDSIEGKLQPVLEEHVTLRLLQYVGEVRRVDVGADDARELAEPIRRRQEHAFRSDRLAGAQVDQHAGHADDAVCAAFVGAVGDLDGDGVGTRLVKRIGLLVAPGGAVVLAAVIVGVRTGNCPGSRLAGGR